MVQGLWFHVVSSPSTMVSRPPGRAKRTTPPWPLPVAARARRRWKRSHCLARGPRCQEDLELLKLMLFHVISPSIEFHYLDLVGESIVLFLDLSLGFVSKSKKSHGNSYGWYVWDDHIYIYMWIAMRRKIKRSPKKWNWLRFSGITPVMTPFLISHWFTASTSKKIKAHFDTD